MAGRVKRIVPWAVVLALVLLGWTGWQRFNSRPPEVEVLAPTREDVVRVLAVTGRVRARFSNTVQPLVAGTIISLKKDEGDRVRRGEILAVLDAQVTRAAVDQAAAQLASRRVDVEQRRREVDRLERLVSAGGLPERDAEQARFGLDAAKESVRQLEALVNESRSRLRDFTLVSPMDGYILSRPVDPGQNVTPQTVVFEISSGSGAEVEVDIDEQYLGELREGLLAQVAPFSGRGTDYEATVSSVGRRVREASGAVPVRLAFRGEAPRLPVGLSVDVNIEIARHAKATTIARAAVAGLGAAPYVMVVRSDTVRRQEVSVIDWPAERIVVERGLALSDYVVADPRAVRAGLVVRTKVRSAL